MGKSEATIGQSKSWSSVKQKSCQVCKRCKRENCGKCVKCLDMRIFGGPGKMKAKCQERVCERKRPSTPSSDHKSPALRKVGSEPVLKSKDAVDKSGESRTTSKNLPTSKEATKGETVKESQTRKASDLSKTPQSSPRSQSNSSTPSVFRVKPVTVKTIVPSPKLVETKAASAQKDSDVNSGDATRMPQRSSARIKSIMQTTPQNSPNEKLPRVADTSDTVQAKELTALTKQFYGKEIQNNATVENQTENSQLENKQGITKTTDSEGEKSESMSCSPEKAFSLPTKKNVDLPLVKLDSMTKSELKEFIPKLLKLVTGKEEVFYSRRSAKPEWWPEDVTWAASRSAWHNEKYWTDNLKSVVKSCYKYVGKENLLQNLASDTIINSRSTDISGYKDIGNEDKVKIGSYPTSPVKIRMFPQGLYLPFSAEIYLCYFCAKEFLSKEAMRSHQNGCKERPPDLQKYSSEVAPFDTSQCITPPAMSPKKEVNRIWSQLSLDKFSSQLGLVAKQAAAKLREQRLSVEEVNCEILDEPTSPVTPKTPKSLISQLSRDDSAHPSRKRLSYSISMDSHKDIKDHIESESESDSESDVGLAQKHVHHEMNLLDIPVSSLLGQRIKNYVHSDAPAGIVEDTTPYCRTPVKNTFLEKLRRKPLAYPILYRPRRVANLHKQNHVYRFKKSEVKEFMCKINTGLNFASLTKARRMKRFSIRLQRLSRKKLLAWMSRRQLDKQLRGAFKGLKYNPYSELDSSECEFPSGPSLLVKNIDRLLGLKKRTAQESSSVSLSLSNLISEEMEAELSKQKLTLYRSLLYEMSVLKPAVVMEDIAGNVRYSRQDIPFRSQSTDSLTNPNNEETREVKPRSVFRDMCRKSREERLIAEAEERERKEEYKSLKALLKAPLQNFNRLVVGADLKTPESQVIDNKKVKQSPIDDSVSIMSAASEGESLHSNCCTGCNDKRHRSVPSEDIVPNKSCVTPLVVQPLHVDVEEDGQNKMDDYGIPSPMSLSSESPYPPTPSKSSIGVPEETSKLIDPLEMSPLLKRETRSTRSSGLLSLSKESLCSPKSPVVKSLTESDTDTVTCVLLNLNRVQSEGVQTRSCSGTPNGSPVKRLTRSGSSAPTSPSKLTKLNKHSLDIKQVSKRLDIPTLKADVTMSLRSGTKTGEVTNIEASNPSTAKDLVNLQTKSDLSRENSGSHVDEESPNHKVAGDSISMDSPLRRSKRKSSILIGDDPLSIKKRKVLTDTVMQHNISKQL